MPQIHIQYNENPLNITKHSMSAYILPYIFEVLCIQSLLAPKKHNPDHKIDCLHNTSVGS